MLFFLLEAFNVLLAAVVSTLIQFQFHLLFEKLLMTNLLHREPSMRLNFNQTDPLIWSFLQHPINQLFRGISTPCLFRILNSSRDNIFNQHFYISTPSEWKCPKHHDKHHNSNRPDICYFVSKYHFS